MTTDNPNRMAVVCPCCDGAIWANQAEWSYSLQRDSKCPVCWGEPHSVYEETAAAYRLGGWKGVADLGLDAIVDREREILTHGRNPETEANHWRGWADAWAIEGDRISVRTEVIADRLQSEFRDKMPSVELGNVMDTLVDVFAKQHAITEERLYSMAQHLVPSSS